MFVENTVGELKDWTNRQSWSKTTPNTDGMGGARVNPSSSKMRTFILLSLTLTEPSLNNFQLNGGKWPPVSVRDTRKNVPILQVGGSTLDPPIPSVFRVVLLQKLRFVQSFNSPTVGHTVTDARPGEVNIP